MSFTESQLLSYIQTYGESQGYTADQIQAAQAVAVSEAGWSGNGDGGTSFGPFQFHIGGEADNFASWLTGQLSKLFSPAQAGQYAIDNWQTAVQWALNPSGYLGQALNEGASVGYSGPDLAYYLSDKGQGSANPQAAYNDYAKIPGLTGQAPAPQPTINSGTPGVPALPDPSKIIAGAIPQPVQDTFTNILQALSSVGSSLATATNDVTTFVGDIRDITTFLQEPALWTRLVVGILGGLILLVGLLAFGVSLLPKGGLPKVVPV